MISKHRSGLAMAAILAAAFTGGPARAGGIAVTNNTSASSLVNALQANGSGGITITNVSLSGQDDGQGRQSTGVYTANGPNHYNLQGTGIVLSTGNAAALGSGPVVPDLSTAYNTDATAAQAALLAQVSPKSGSFHDVTQLTLTFDAGPNTTSVHFGAVFGSAEYPTFVGSFIDAFGLFLNGKNIAVAGGNPVNIDNPLMVNTDANDLSGNVQPQYQETALQGLLVGPGGNPFIDYGGAVTPGSTGNMLTFIIADSNDSNLDTAVYVSALGNAPPPNTVPEPSSLVLLGLGATALAFLSRRMSARA